MMCFNCLQFGIGMLCTSARKDFRRDHWIPATSRVGPATQSLWKCHGHLRHRDGFAGCIQLPGWRNEAYGSTIKEGSTQNDMIYNIYIYILYIIYICNVSFILYSSSMVLNKKTVFGLAQVAWSPWPKNSSSDAWPVRCAWSSSPASSAWTSPFSIPCTRGSWLRGWPMIQVTHWRIRSA